MEFKKTLNKDIVVVILLLIIQFIFSETYDFMTSQSCSTSRDCPESKNLICLHVYEGCHRGYCACHPHNSTNDKSGNCVPLLHWGDICEPGLGECRRPMTCEGGRCRCPQGYHMVKDGKHCLEKSARLVGQRCLNHEGRHRKCYRETTDSTGFTQNDVTCSISTGTCVCNEGFKTLGHQCLTRRLGDHGCRTSIHCEGGAVCSDGRCVCPTGYMPDDNFYKCLRLDAETNIELGGSCDEVNENRYCAPGFVCYRCAEEIQDKCIRFLLSTEYGISKAHAMSANIVVVVIFIIEQFMSPFATVISRILNC